MPDKSAPQNIGDKNLLIPELLKSPNSHEVYVYHLPQQMILTFLYGRFPGALLWPQCDSCLLTKYITMTTTLRVHTHSTVPVTVCLRDQLSTELGFEPGTSSLVQADVTTVLWGTQSLSIVLQYRRSSLPCRDVAGELFFCSVFGWWQ